MVVCLLYAGHKKAIFSTLQTVFFDTANSVCILVNVSIGLSHKLQTDAVTTGIKTFDNKMIQHFIKQLHHYSIIKLDINGVALWYAYGWFPFALCCSNGMWPSPFHCRRQRTSSWWHRHFQWFVSGQQPRTYPACGRKLVDGQRTDRL